MFEMNENQKALFAALTPLQKEISLNIISGMNDIDAYKNSKGKAKKESTMRASVSEILTNPNVKAFIDSMADHIVNPAIMSRNEMMERLSGLARTNMNDLVTWGIQGDTEASDKEDDSKNQGQQSVWVIKPSAIQDPTKIASISELTAGKEGFKIKQHSPLAAMKQLAELAGYEAPTKTDLTSSDGSMSPKQMTDEQLLKIANE